LLEKVTGHAKPTPKTSVHNMIEDIAKKRFQKESTIFCPRFYRMTQRSPNGGIIPPDGPALQAK
jgi:hypothetical protein